MKDEKALTVIDNSPNEMLFNEGKFAQAQRVARLFAESSFVPDTFRNNIQNCFIALNMSCRMGIDPYMVFQNMYVVHGKPGIQAQLVIAMVNRNGPFEGPVEFELTGKGVAMACTAYGLLKGSGRRCEATVDWNMVAKEGWDKTTGSKWKSMPEQMFKYRSAVFLARTYCPEVMMGLQTVEEIHDIKNQDEPKVSKVTSVLEKMEESKPKPKVVIKDNTQKMEESKPKPKVVIKDNKQKKENTTKKPSNIIEQPNGSLPNEADVRLEMLMKRANTVGLTSEAVDRMIGECQMDKFDKSTQTERRLADFAAAIEDHNSM